MYDIFVIYQIKWMVVNRPKLVTWKKFIFIYKKEDIFVIYQTNWMLIRHVTCIHTRSQYIWRAYIVIWKGLHVVNTSTFNLFMSVSPDSILMKSFTQLQVIQTTGQVVHCINVYIKYMLLLKFTFSRIHSLVVYLE